MSLIVSEVYDALVAAGAPEEKARAAAAAIPIVENLATKDDVAAVREDVAALKLVNKDDIAGIREDVAALKLANKNDIEVLRHDIGVLKLAVFSFAPAVLALLGKLVFFP